VADALESISKRGGTAADLAARVAAVAPQSGTCPLCAALAERERQAVSEVPDGHQPRPLRRYACATWHWRSPQTHRRMSGGQWPTR
jgi:hypothetical protein